MNGYAKRLNRYKAGQSPTTLHPERTRTFKPGLSWLGDDEFESTGLAFKLARHQIQRTAANGRTGHTDSYGDHGSRPRRNDGGTGMRARTSDNTKRNTFRPKRDPVQNPHPKKVDLPKTGPSTMTTTSNRTPKPSPTPQTPVHVNFGSTDFTSLFGASPSLSVAPSPTSTKITATDAVSRRVQLTLECHGGDYSKLVPNSLANSQGDPLVYAASTVARRRDLGPNGRINALEIVRGMVGKPLTL